MLDVVLGNYFDDFPQLDLGPTAQESLEELLAVLGFDVSLVDKKRFPFSRTFVCLGAQITLDTLRTTSERQPGRSWSEVGFRPKGVLRFRADSSMRRHSISAGSVAWSRVRSARLRCRDGPGTPSGGRSGQGIVLEYRRPP